MNKAIFLDRDGTINEDYGYVYEISKFKYRHNTIKGLKEFVKMGYKLIIITNQSGIGRKYYTEEDLKKLNDYIISDLKRKGIIIEKIYWCPHISEDNCECRKPKLKLFYDAKEEFNIDFSISYAIGDKVRDLNICNYEKIGGILISNSNDDSSNYNVCKDLYEASQVIKKKINS